MATFIGIRSFANPIADLDQNQRRPRLDRGRLKSACVWALGASLSVLAVSLALPVGAQIAGTDASVAAVSASVLNLVRWTGTASEAAGRTVEMSFALYQDPAGGLALWSETQTVKVGADGRYAVLLGATSAEGLPQTLFQGGEARWIEVRLIEAQLIAASGGDAVAEVANATPPARSLLAAVPYALKSMDAETLAGRSADDYVTREDLKSTVADQVQATQTVGLPLPIGGTSTAPGSGTAGLLPVWTTPSTLGSSLIAQSGANVGIGTIAPATMLDVNGASTLRGVVSLLATAATLASGTNSPALQLGASAYSSASRAAVPQNFVWQAESSGNNTASPTANLALLFGSGNTTPAATGLAIAPNGQITFAPGQTFPGVSNSPGTGTGSSTITGVTAGSGLTGGGSTGNVTLALSMPISTANGGTGASTPDEARANLGAVPVQQIGGLTQADQQPGKDFGQKVANCLAAAIAAGSNVCDARNLIGKQSLSANLVLTTSNASNMTLLLAANVTINQGSYQVLIQPGVTNFSVVGTGSWSTQGSNGASAGTTFSYSGADYAWKVVGGVLNTWTMYIRLQDFAIIAPGTTSASGLFLGPEVQDVYLERMRIALPGGSSGHSLHMYGGAASSGMYSSFAHIDAPEFVGGAGVLVDGDTTSYFSVWAQDNVFGGRIMATSKSVTGSMCVNILAGEFSMHGTDLENCDIGLHTSVSGGVQPYLRPDGGGVNTGVQFDGSHAYGNTVTTSSPTNSEINGAARNNIIQTSNNVYSDLGAGGSNVSNYQFANVPLNFVLAAGKTASQYVNLFFGDGSTGTLHNQWKLYKEPSGAFKVDDLVSGNNRVGLAAGANANSSISANGSGVVSFNYASGTGGVVFGNGAGTNTASISSFGVGTFSGIADTEVTGSTQCAQFTASGVLVGTGVPCATGSSTGTAAPVRWTFVGISPGAANGGPWGRYTPDVNVTIISEEYTFYGAPTGCSSYPTMYLADNGTTIAGSKQRLDAIGGSYTGLVLNVAAGHTITISTVPGTGCTGQNSGVYTITLKPKGSN
jgi:hypothetical protein